MTLPANDLRSNPAGRKHAKPKNGALPVFLAVGLVVMPKCPLCCAAYVGLLSSLGITSFPFFGWVLPILGSLLVLNLFLMALAVEKRLAYGPFILSVLGTASILTGKFWLGSATLCWIGVTLILVGAAWNFATSKKACASRFHHP